MARPFAVPPRLRHDFPSRDWMDRSAPASIDYLCDVMGIEDLGSTEVLDVGCGTKFTESFLNHGKPVRRYVGVDVDRETIEFLRGNVHDPRFEYHHVDLANARYNPDGRALTEETTLPLAEGSDFDLICLFSVFTHLDPHDYRAMLKVLRRYIRPAGRLFFSLFLDERSEDGHGLMDSVANALGDSAVGTTDGFRDLQPENALAYALYSRTYAIELIEGTGWEIVRLDPPTEFVQHHITCRPVGGTDARSPAVRGT